MNRTPLIAGNWKMYKTVSEAISETSKLLDLTKGITDIDIMVAPNFISLYPVASLLKGSSVSTGAQNCFYKSEGAYTGEVSAPMVKAAGADYVLIGHSERRQYFSESDETVQLRIEAALEASLRPVLCIGETEKEKDEKKTTLVLDKQIKNGLKGFRSDELNDLVIAYEPVWAIGTGKTATPDLVNEVHQYIRSLIREIFDPELAKSLRIVYGGSVKPENATELMSLEDVDGALVGGASLDAGQFIKIINYDR